LTLNAGEIGGGAWGITEDASGNVYVLGGQFGTSNLLGYWKIAGGSGGGTFVTIIANPGAGVSSDAIAVDSNGKVWLDGDVSSTTFYYAEGTATGVQISGNPDNVWCLGADKAGNVYYIGSEKPSSNETPYYWKNGVNPTQFALSSSNTQGYPSSMAVDSSGNIYVAGEQWGAPSGGPVYWKATSGVWQSATPLPVGSYTGANWNVSAVAVDSSGNLGVAAGEGITNNTTNLLYWKGATSTPALMTLPSGATIFRNLDNDSAAFDSSGNLIVAGQVGTTWSGTPNNSPMTDGIPVYWTNGTPTKLPLGGNAWGVAQGAVAGP